VNIRYFSAILIKREIVSLIKISVLLLKDNISLIDIVASTALKSVKYHWFWFRKYNYFDSSTKLFSFL